MSPNRLVTRCPQCETQFRITEEQLNAAGGKARCSRCSQVFNARLFLQSPEPVPTEPSTPPPPTAPEPAPTQAVEPTPPPRQEPEIPASDDFDLDLSDSSPDQSAEQTDTFDFELPGESIDPETANESIDIDALFAETDPPAVGEGTAEASGEYDFELPEQPADQIEDETLEIQETVEAAETPTEEPESEPFDIDALFVEAEASDTGDTTAKTASEFDTELPGSPADQVESETFEEQEAFGEPEPETTTEESDSESFDIDALLAETETSERMDVSERSIEFDFELPEQPAESNEPDSLDTPEIVEKNEPETGAQESSGRQDTFDFELNFDDKEEFELDLESTDDRGSTAENPELTDLGFGFDTSEFDAYGEEEEEASATQPEATTPPPEPDELATTAEQIEEQLSQAYEAALGDVETHESESAPEAMTESEPAEEHPEAEAPAEIELEPEAETPQEEEKAEEELPSTTTPEADVAPESEAEEHEDFAATEEADEEDEPLFDLDEQGSPVEIETGSTQEEFATTDDSPVEPTDEALGLVAAEPEDLPEVEPADDTEAVEAESLGEPQEAFDEPEPIEETAAPEAVDMEAIVAEFETEPLEMEGDEDQESDYSATIEKELEASLTHEQSRWPGIAFGSGALLLLLGLVIQSAYFFRVELSHYPALVPTLESICQVAGCEIPARRDVEKIHLVNRDVRPHPHQTNALLISLTLVSETDFPQPLPTLEVSFSDTSGRLVALRRFHPQEYVGEDFRHIQELVPREPLPVSLAIADPGAAGISYRFEFY